MNSARPLRKDQSFFSLFLIPADILVAKRPGFTIPTPDECLTEPQDTRRFLELSQKYVDSQAGQLTILADSSICRLINMQTHQYADSLVCCLTYKPVGSQACRLTNMSISSLSISRVHGFMTSGIFSSVSSS